MKNERLPDEDFVADLVEKRMGRRPEAIRRFTTGTSHYVYEAIFVASPSLVVRIGSA